MRHPVLRRVKRTSILVAEWTEEEIELAVIGAIATDLLLEDRPLNSAAVKNQMGSPENAHFNSHCTQMPSEANKHTSTSSPRSAYHRHVACTSSPIATFPLHLPSPPPELVLSHATPIFGEGRPNLHLLESHRATQIADRRV